MIEEKLSLGEPTLHTFLTKLGERLDDKQEVRSASRMTRLFLHTTTLARPTGSGHSK